MKKITALLLAVFTLTLPTTAFTDVTLLDYQKDWALVATWTCDSGETTIHGYTNSNWKLLETRSASRTIFISFHDDAEESFLVQYGNSEIKNVTHEEFDALLVKEALMAYRAMHGIKPSDCKRQ